MISAVPIFGGSVVKNKRQITRPGVGLDLSEYKIASHQETSNQNELTGELKYSLQVFAFSFVGKNLLCSTNLCLSLTKV